MLSTIQRTVYAALLAAVPAIAQQVPFLVELDGSLVPDRTVKLEALRSHIRGGATQTVYDTAIAELKSLDSAAAAPVRGAIAALGGTVDHEYWALGALAARLPTGADTALAMRADVVSVAPDRRLGATIFAQTSSANHNADAVQATGLTGAGVTLALIDSGIDLEVGTGGPPHPAFLDASGANRIIAAVGIADPLDAEDTTGHGTAVAGIAAARDWSPIGTTDDGFAPDACIASYKITHDALDNYWSSDWLAAWHRVLEDRVRYDIAAAVASYSGNPSPTDLTQRITDIVGWYGDVLIASSAGNGGELPMPAAQSQANTNGLVIGAVDGGQHRVAGFSSRGPLPGAPMRTWPDLVAVGVAVFAPAPDNAGGTGLPRTGTSFAAPTVAGTALLIRAAAASLSSLDTKAVILNSTADVSSSNPGGSVYDFGLGLLRTDLAVSQAQTGAFHHGPSGPSGTVTTIAVPVQHGTRYAATLAWPRVDVDSPDWNDLDLRVRDDQGAALAMSRSPSNAYERVQFTALVNGTYTIDVITTDAPAPTAAWSLVVAEHAVGGAQHGSFVVGRSTCSGFGVNPAANPIVPASANGAFASERTSLPLADLPTRTQQAFDGATVPSGLTIDALAFRRDEQQPGADGWELDIEVLMGHTLFAPSALGPTFANNWDGPPTQVLRDTALTLRPASGAPSGPSQFDYLIPLALPFTTATHSNRHLVVEISVFSHSRGSQRFGMWLDAAVDFTDHARVWTQGTPFAASGMIDALAPVMALVTNSATAVVPRLDLGGSLLPGGRLEVSLRQAAPQAPAALAHAQAPFAPIDLGVVGAPGCTLESAATVVLPVDVDSLGRALVEFGLVSTPELVGAEFFQQFVVLDPGANALGVTTTGLGSGLIGGS